MAEVKKMTAEFKAEIDKFFKETVKVYEAGARPEYIEDRPFLKTLPGDASLYIGKNGLTDNSFKVSIGLDAIEAATKESETENSEYLRSIEERYRKVKPDAQFIIIDPDVVRNRYANDASKDRSLFKSFTEYLSGRLAEEGRSQDFPMRTNDYYELLGAAITGNSPLSATMPTNPTKENLQGDGQFSVVISSHPDMRMHGMFADIIGCNKRLAEHGFDKRAVDEMILTHELGHALDQRNRYEEGDQFLDTKYKRHKTECVADAYAILQAARRDKNTAMGEILADIRADNTAEGMAYVMEEAEKMFGVPAAGLNLTGMKCSEGFLGRSHDGMPEMKAFVELMKKQAKKAKKAKPVKKAEVNELSESQEKEPTIEDAFNGMYSASVMYQMISTASSIAAYRTTPTVDATCETANKMLKDGSLLEKTDKEIHALAEKIVDASCLPKDRFAALCYGAITGQATEDMVEIGRRDEQGKQNFPEDPEKLLEQKMAAMGVPAPVKKPTKEEAVAFHDWIRDVEIKVKEAGGTKKDLLVVMGKEKDAIRKDDSILRDYKMSVINESFLKDAKGYSEKARTIATVEQSVEKMAEPKAQVSGAKAVGKYIASELAGIGAAEAYLADAAQFDSSVMDVDAIVKSANKNASSMKKVLKSEKASQTYAKIIMNDKEAMEILETSPELAKRVAAKAEGKHPGWIDDAYLNMATKDEHRTENLANTVALEKRNLAVISAMSKSVAASLSKGVKTKLNAMLPKKFAMKKIKPTEEKANPYADPDNMIWNRLGNSGR